MSPWWQLQLGQQEQQVGQQVLVLGQGLQHVVLGPELQHVVLGPELEPVPGLELQALEKRRWRPVLAQQQLDTCNRCQRMRWRDSSKA